METPLLIGGLTEREELNIARIANAVPCHSVLKGYVEIVRNVISVSKVTM